MLIYERKDVNKAMEPYDYLISTCIMRDWFIHVVFLLLKFLKFKGGFLMDDLLFVIPANSKKEDILSKLKEHPEIKFVSLVGIDLAGNDTDEKIPVQIFLDDIDKFYEGSAVQTDGSSVVLTNIATLNNAKVDMPIDPSVNWFIDYNMENFDEEAEKPIGTLRIPAFLIHEGKRVDSRASLSAWRA